VGGQFDEPLDQQTAALVAGHLDDCAECRGIERTLTLARGVLATLAEIEPGLAFTAQVVAATSGRTVRARRPLWVRLSRRWAWAESFGDRAAGLWERLLARPRLSLELAYLATVLVLIIIGNPGLIAGALGAPTTAPMTGQAASAGAGAEDQALVSEGTRSLMPAFVGRAMREVESRQAAAAKGWNGFVERTSRLLSASWDWLRGLFGWIAAQPAPSAPTEPARAPVRASQ
jgi:hypothetical protein